MFSYRTITATSSFSRTDTPTIAREMPMKIKHRNSFPASAAKSGKKTHFLSFSGVLQEKWLFLTTNTPMSVTDSPVSATNTPMSVINAGVSVTNPPVFVADTGESEADSPVSVTVTPVFATETPVSVADTPALVTDSPVSVAD
jgi:hypothetical protein